MALPTTNPLINSLVSSVWRALGLIMLFLAKPSVIALEKRKHISFALVFNNKSFLLYLIPWIMFSLIDGFETVVFGSFLEPVFYNFLRVVGAIIGTVSALVSGLMADYIGRKRVVIYGFISLGLAYAVIGIAPANIISWYFYSVIDGIAWGIFTVAFFLVLWGDLSSNRASEKYYAIGSIPFFLAELIGFLFVPLASIPANAAFSVASLFLFVAVLPLMYAPETLPEKKIRLRRLRKYMDAAKKVKEKYTKGAEG
jgi:MFS family permease